MFKQKWFFLGIIVVLFCCACGSGSPYKKRGKVFFDEQKYEDAIPELKVALRKNPHDFEIHLWLGMSYARTQKVHFSLQYFQEAYELAPSHRDVVLQQLFDCGQWALEKKKMKSAMQYYERLLQYSPYYEMGATAYNIGAYYFQQGRYEQTILMYEQAIQHAPENPHYFTALFEVARAYQKLGEKQFGFNQVPTYSVEKDTVVAAADSLANVDSIAFAASLPESSLDSTWEKFSDPHFCYQKAIYYYEVLLKMAEDRAVRREMGHELMGNVRFNLGDVNMRLGNKALEQEQHTAAVAFFERVIELQEPKIKLEEAFFKVGEIYYLQGNAAKAKQYYEKVLEHNRTRRGPFVRISQERLNAIRKNLLYEQSGT